MANVSGNAAADPASSDKSFVIRLARSGCSFEIPADQSILDVLCANYIDVDYNCCEGICGTCLVRVLEGEADHRDAVMTDEERNSGLIAICCSRSLTPTLVIDV